MLALEHVSTPPVSKHKSHVFSEHTNGHTSSLDCAHGRKGRFAQKHTVLNPRFRKYNVFSKHSKSRAIPSKTLEGFLFPETYFFQESDSPEEILSQLTEEYKNNVPEELKNRADSLGFSELEMITLASIIEGEAIYNSERSTISAVYHNRLKLGMKLQADPTIQYIIKDSPRRLLNKDLKIDSPYNTYLHNGLPPAPVNNPGKASILAALFPEENEFLYCSTGRWISYIFQNSRRT